MFANKLIAPFALLALLVFAYSSWTGDGAYSFFVIPPLVIAALIYILSPQINWWWYSRHMPDLSEELTLFLERFCLFYRKLSVAERRQFRGRIVMFNMGTDWEALAFPEDNLPPDIQMAIAAQAVSLTFYKEKFLFDKFEKVLVFPQPFPTPEHPYDHASEMHVSDGCLLFSAAQVMLAYTQPLNWYNVALHEYSKAFVFSNPSEPWPAFDAEDVWERLEKVSGMPRAHVESVVGLAGLDALPVALHHFIVFQERFAMAFPEEYPTFMKILGSAAKQAVEQTKALSN